MERNSGNLRNQHVINIWEVNPDRLNSMSRKISEKPRLLSESAGGRSCCIFRVPQSFIEINGKVYQPNIISIGPYHHGKQHLSMIEEHKWRFLRNLLTRTQSIGLSLEDYLKAIHPLEQKARDCYSEAINLTADEFIEMLVLDGCFIVELFRKFARLVDTDEDDPIFSMSWIYPFLLRDLLKVENQIPFFILKSLFELSKLPDEKSSSSLTTIALEFFNNAVQRPDESIAKYHDLKPKHILELLRSSFVIPDLVEPENPIRGTHVIECVTKLRRAGIRFKQPRETHSFLDIKFRHGVIEMPMIAIDDFMSSFLLNCVAFEQCQGHSSKQITTYATFLDCLINTPKDVGYLCDNNIIENYYGTEGEMAKFVNDLGKEVFFDIEKSYLSELFNDVNNYYRNNWHVQWATFRHTYFDTPWSFVSALAAVVLLFLTLTQTFFAVYGYILPPQ